MAEQPSQTASPSTTYKSRFPEIYPGDIHPSIVPSPRTQQSQLQRERIRNLRMSTFTDIILCICALCIVAIIIYVVASGKYIEIR